MALKDPVAVYDAASQAEAHLLRDALIAAGVEAHVTEDASQAEGRWVGGFVPESHRPQVWVERANVERVKPLLDEYDRRRAEQEDRKEAVAEGPPVEAVCDECGKTSSFPASQRGSVQECPHCHAYMDVGGDDFPDEWKEGAAEEESEEP